MTKTNVKFEDYERLMKEADLYFEKLIKEDFKKKTGRDLDEFSNLEAERNFVEQLSKVKFG